MEDRDLPGAGELEVTRLATFEFDREAGEEVARDSYEGAWALRFSI